MTLDQALNHIRSRLRRRAFLSSTVFFSSALGPILLIGVLIALLSPFAAIIIISIAILAVVAFSAKRIVKGDFSQRIAAELFDRTLHTKERALTVSNWNEADNLDKREFINDQLRSNLQSFNAAQIVVLELKASEKRNLAISLCCLLVACALLIVLEPFRNQARTAEARAIEELITENPQLPEQVKEKLQELSTKLEQEPLTSEEVDRALQEAEEQVNKSLEELKNNQTELATTENKRDPKEKVKEKEPQVQPTPESHKDEQKSKQNEQDPKQGKDEDQEKSGDICP